jgi:hypothetical protein
VRLRAVSLVAQVKPPHPHRPQPQGIISTVPLPSVPSWFLGRAANDWRDCKAAARHW